MKTLILLSLLANLLLAGWWFKGRPVERASVPATAPKSANQDFAQTSTATQGASFSSTSWRDIQAEDLKEFIQRLRAVGCPEKTIQDLILAEVNRRFAGRNRAIMPPQFARQIEEQPFWKTEKPKPGTEQSEQRKAQYESWRNYNKAEKALLKEKSALLVELLGVDPEKEQRLAEGMDSEEWEKTRYSYLPEAKQEAVTQYLAEFNEKMQDFYARAAGSWNATNRAEQRRLEAEKVQGLANILSPQELREFELRESQTASQLISDLHHTSLSRQQYEVLFDIRKKYGDSVMDWGDTPDTTGKIAENQKRMKAEIATALGETKTSEIERAGDYDFRTIQSFAKHYNLPADTAAKVYDFKSTAEASVKALQASTELTAEQRTAALQQISAETASAVKLALGDKAYKRYLNSRGWWLKSLAPESGATRP